jgi:hypothetical protein
VDDRHLHELAADGHGGVQGGHGLLVDHGDLGAADGAELLGLSLARSRPLKRIEPPVIRPLTPGPA